MAVTPEAARWERLFAARTRGDVGEGIAAVLAFLGVPDLISFAGGFPDPRTFPRERTSELLAEFAAAGESTAFQYAPTRGLAGPLDALASRLETTQGRRPADDELLITSGAIEALELVGKTFLERGDLVVVEAPTYLGAIMAFRTFECEVLAVPMDEHGLDVDGAGAAARRRPAPEARLHDSRPPEPVGHQPLGRAARGTRRARAAARLPDRRGRRVPRARASTDDAAPSLWSLAPDVVVQAGTTSKTFFPGVRLGWAVGPAEISAQLVAAKQTTDQCAGALGQRLFEEYVRRGWIDEQLAQSRALYRRKSEQMLAALERHMPAGVRWTRPHGGFFTWLTLPEGGDSGVLAQRAVESGVGIVPGLAVLPGRSRRRQREAVVQHGRRGPDRRGHRAARVTRSSVANTQATSPCKRRLDKT